MTLIVLPNARLGLVDSDVYRRLGNP